MLIKVPSLMSNEEFQALMLLVEFIKGQDKEKLYDKMFVGNTTYTPSYLIKQLENYIEKASAGYQQKD